MSGLRRIELHGNGAGDVKVSGACAAGDHRACAVELIEIPARLVGPYGARDRELARVRCACPCHADA